MKDINIIERYSEMKITTKPGPEYSTLNPDTNSDSPSAKSKGERFVSARITTKRINIRCESKRQP